MLEPMGDILILTTDGEASSLFVNDWLTTVEVEGHWYTAQEI